MTFTQFRERHEAQLKALPPRLNLQIWKKTEKSQEALMSELHDVFDVDNCRVKVDLEELTLFVVPHLVTFSMETLKQTLQTHHDLLHRLVKKKFPKEWKMNLREDVFALTDGYQLSIEAGKPPTQFWFVAEETLLLMKHDDKNPLFKTLEFFHVLQGKAYTLLWNPEAVKAGDAASRNFLATATDAERRDLELMFFPWRVSERKDEYAGELQSWIDSKPNSGTSPEPVTPLPLWKSTTIKIFADDVVKLFGDLDGPAFSRFTLVNSHRDADLIWLGRKLSPSIRASIKPNQFVNQFPGQDVLTVKDMLAKAIWDKFGLKALEWFPWTFNMNHELRPFLGKFSEEATTWLTKPWNSARSQNIVIARGLPCLLRQLSSGPKVVSKYIHPPNLFRGKKYDIRVNVLLDSVAPLKLYTCPRYQYPRVASDDYDVDLKDLDDFGSNFSVMNYAGPQFKWHIVSHDEFVKEWNDSNGKSWQEDIVPKIHVVCRKVFEAAIHSAKLQSDLHAKALFGLDFMLDSLLNPFVIEVSMTSDTGRVLRMDPDFYSKLWRFAFTKDRNNLELQDIFVEI